MVDSVGDRRYNTKKEKEKTLRATNWFHQPSSDWIWTWPRPLPVALKAGNISKPKICFFCTNAKCESLWHHTKDVTSEELQHYNGQNQQGKFAKSFADFWLPEQAMVYIPGDGLTLLCNFWNLNNANVKHSVRQPLAPSQTAELPC